MHFNSIPIRKGDEADPKRKYHNVFLQKYCQANGGDLVSLETTQENVFLKSQLALLKSKNINFLWVNRAYLPFQLGCD